MFLQIASKAATGSSWIHGFAVKASWFERDFCVSGSSYIGLDQRQLTLSASKMWLKFY